MKVSLYKASWNLEEQKMGEGNLVRLRSHSLVLGGTQVGGLKRKWTQNTEAAPGHGKAAFPPEEQMGVQGRAAAMHRPEDRRGEPGLRGKTPGAGSSPPRCSLIYFHQTVPTAPAGVSSGSPPGSLCLGALILRPSVVVTSIGSSGRRPRFLFVLVTPTSWVLGVAHSRCSR